MYYERLLMHNVQTYVFLLGCTYQFQGPSGARSADPCVTEEITATIIHTFGGSLMVGMVHIRGISYYSTTLPSTPTVPRG